MKLLLEEMIPLVEKVLLEKEVLKSWIYINQWVPMEFGKKFVISSSVSSTCRALTMLLPAP